MNTTYNHHERYFLFLLNKKHMDLVHSYLQKVQNKIGSNPMVHQSDFIN